MKFRGRRIAIRHAPPAGSRIATYIRELPAHLLPIPPRTQVMLLARPLALHRGYLPSPPEEPWLFNKFDANSRGIVRAASWTDHESRSFIANNAADSGRSEVHHALRALIEEVKQVEPGFLPVGVR